MINFSKLYKKGAQSQNKIEILFIIFKTFKYLIIKIVNLDFFDFRIQILLSFKLIAIKLINVISLFKFLLRCL